MAATTAAQDLDAAQTRADVQVRAVSDLIDLDTVRWVCDSVWSSDNGGTEIQRNLLRAISHSGGYASVAYRGERPVGAGVGIVGRHRTSEGWHEHLHSHMVAVLDGYRDQHIGVAIKQHQRAWCLEQDLDTVVWTFDPLVRRNARLNIIKLGVDVEGFVPNFYGNMDDSINRGDPTDRLFAWWRVDSQRAQDAAAGRLAPLDPARLVGRDIRTIDLPADIVEVRMRNLDEAITWRMNVREALERNFADGYRIIGLTLEGGYLMERES